MRVRLGELSPREREERERVCAAARVAWANLVAGDEEGARFEMERIDNRLSMNVVPNGDDVRSIELVPLEVSAVPLAELCLSLAPADLRYSLSLGRPAMPLEAALAEVRASHGVSLARSSLRAGFGRGHLLEVTLGVPGGVGSENEQNAAESLVRAVLGDRLFETWVGEVHVTAAPRGGPLRVLDITAPRATLTLGELFETVAAAARGVLEGLPEVEAVVAAHGELPGPVRATADGDDARGDWTMFEIDADAHVDLDAEVDDDLPKRDLVLVSTCTPELLRCYLDGAPCSSRRFSRAGERFVFVSYVDELASMRARIARRSVIEAALTACSRDIGRITGVGFGVRTTHVDVALRDLETGLPRLVSKLQELDLPARSYVHFFDSELREEWLSIWPDAAVTES